MAFTQEQLDALEDAIAKGVTEVKYEDKTLTYRSINEMLQIRDIIRRALGLAEKTGRVFTKTSKGLC